MPPHILNPFWSRRTSVIPNLAGFFLFYFFQPLIYFPQVQAQKGAQCSQQTPGAGLACHPYPACERIPERNPHFPHKTSIHGLSESAQCTFRSSVLGCASARHHLSPLPCFCQLFLYSHDQTEHPPYIPQNSINSTELLPSVFQKKQDFFNSMCLKQPQVDNNNNLRSLPSFLCSQ